MRNVYSDNSENGTYEKSCTKYTTNALKTWTETSH